jgi:hypothetical protein
MDDALEALFKEALEQSVGRGMPFVRKNAHEQAMCHRAWKDTGLTPSTTGTRRQCERARGDGRADQCCL